MCLDLTEIYKTIKAYRTQDFVSQVRWTMVRFIPTSLIQLYRCIYVKFICNQVEIETLLIQKYVNCPGYRSDCGELANTELFLNEVLCKYISQYSSYELLFGCTNGGSRLSLNRCCVLMSYTSHIIFQRSRVQFK